MIDWVHERLNAWADYQLRGGGYLLGGGSLLGKLVAEGWAAFIHGNSPAPAEQRVPDHIRATETAVFQLDERDQRLVRLHYLWINASREQKAKRCGYSRSGYEHRLHTIHEQLSRHLGGS